MTDEIRGAADTRAAVEEVLSFWLGAGPEAWYKQDDAFDAEITERFGALWEQGAAGALDEIWATNPKGALALIILLDQFPRNMFRGEARAFTATRAPCRWPATRSTGAGTCARARAGAAVLLHALHAFRATDRSGPLRAAVQGTDAGRQRPARPRAPRDHPPLQPLSLPQRCAGAEDDGAEQAFLDEGGYGKILNELKDG
jgi:hypothetical protein